MAVTRRSIDSNAMFGQALAGRVDIVHGIGNVAEIAPARVTFGIPIVRKLNLRRLIPGAARKMSVKRPLG